MIEYTNKDPIYHNPLRKLGISGRSLVGKTPEQAFQLARAVATPLLKSASLPENFREEIAECMSELRTSDNLIAAFNALKGLSPAEEAARVVEVATKLQERALLEERSAWRYQLEQGAAPSLQNGVRMVSAEISVTDVVSLLCSPITESDPLARKLFKRTLESVGDGTVKGGAPLPVAGEIRRDMLGVLHLATEGRPFELQDVRRVLRGLGLVNDPALCIEHYKLSGGDEPATKVQYPRPAHSMYSHFHPIEALERLLVVEVEDIRGGIRAQIPAGTAASCNILLSRCLFGSHVALCIEGVLESTTSSQPRAPSEEVKTQLSSKKPARTSRPSAKTSKSADTSDRPKRSPPKSKRTRME